MHSCIQPLDCAPAMAYFLGRRERERKMLLRGDSDGRIVVWVIPDIHDSKMKLVRQESFEKLPGNHSHPTITILRNHRHEEPPVLKDRLYILGRRSYVSVSSNLSPKTPCLDVPHYYGQDRN